MLRRPYEGYLIMISILLHFLQYFIKAKMPNYYIPLKLKSYLFINEVPGLSYTVIFKNNT